MSMSFLKKTFLTLLEWLSPFKWLLLLLLIFILVSVIFVVIGVVLWNYRNSEIIAEMRKCDFMVLFYYFSSIIGVILTFLAIVTALFKEDILGMIHKPDFDFKLVDGGIYEDLETIRDENGKEHSIAKSFDCYVRIENLGNRTACGCRAFISEIKYKNKKEGNYQTIINQENRRMSWMSAEDDKEKSEVDFPKNIPQKIRLFKISEGMTTPFSEAKAKISFNGCKLPEEYSNNGFWEISCYVSFNKGDISKFKISVGWGEGDFKDRAVDMREKLEVKIL